MNDLPHLETSTSYWINKESLTDQTMDDLRSRLSVLSFRNEDEQIPKAIFEEDFEDGSGYVAIPKIDKKTLCSIVRRNLFFNRQEQYESPTGVKYKLNVSPLEYQVPLIDKVLDIWNNDKEKRICLSLTMGLGKTYISAHLMYLMASKFIFIVYSDKLVKQSYASYCRYLGEEGLYKVEKSSDIELMCTNPSKVRGLFITHAMLRSCYKIYGIQKTFDMIMNKLGITVKIIDEFDREVSNLYKMECYSNFKYSLYLTGTRFKNCRQDDQIFQLIYRNAHILGEDISLEPNKECILVKYKFSPSKKEYNKMQRFDESLFKTYYNDYIARKDLLLDYIMRKFYKPDDSIMKQIIQEGDSILFYCGRIENCNILKDKLVKHFGIDENDIGIYNSAISKSEKTIAESKPWILSTTESMGRGYDNVRIRILVYLEFNFGISSILQSWNRVGRVGGKYGYVIEPIDHSFWKVVANYNKKLRMGLYKTHFKKVTMFEVPDTTYSYYVSGYRPDSKEAVQIKKEKKSTGGLKLSKLL